jgi:hypothetical protein
MSKRGVTVYLDDELEKRVNKRRVSGERIRSFSAVTREALFRWLDVLEQAQQSDPAVQRSNPSEVHAAKAVVISSAPHGHAIANNNAGGAPERV